MEICFSIDIGSESTKAAYAYREFGRVKKDSLLIGGTDFPSFAYCMTPADVGEDSSSSKSQDCWKFGKDAICEAASSSNFRYLVRIGDLLSLFNNKKARNYYDKKSLYKNFYFPPINDGEAYGEDVENDERRRKKYFTAKFGDKPRDVCLKFLTEYCTKLVEEMESILEANGTNESVVYKWVLVYPSNASLEYIEELMTLLKKATGKHSDPKLISVTKAVGAALLEYGLITRPVRSGTAKKTLIFNVGDEKTSVTNVHFRKDNIYTYRLKADKAIKNANFICNEPLDVGGKDFDALINDMLLASADKIPSFGSKGEQSAERGSYAAQFMTMQDIKYGKALFGEQDYYDTVADKGIEFVYTREMKLYIPIKREDFLAAAQEKVFQKIWEYAKEKLLLTCAKDVDTIIFAGGGAETYGLEEYITEQLSNDADLSKRNITYVDFSPKGRAVCKPAYAATIGAALFGIGEYEFTIVTTGAFATSISGGEKCKIIIPKGHQIKLQGKLYEGEESLTIPAFLPRQEGTRDQMPDAFFKLDHDGAKGTPVDINADNIKAYKIKMEKAVVKFKASKAVLEELIACGSSHVDYNYESMKSARPLVCDEGFNIDCEGRGGFFVRNRTVVTKFQGIKLDIEGNMELD